METWQVLLSNIVSAALGALVTVWAKRNDTETVSIPHAYSKLVCDLQTELQRLSERADAMEEENRELRHDLEAVRVEMGKLRAENSDLLQHIVRLQPRPA